LQEQIVHYANSAAAYEELYLAHKCFGEALPARYRGTFKSGKPLAKAAEDLVQALEYTQHALQATGPGEEDLHALWRLCASHMVCCATERTRRGAGAFCRVPDNVSVTARQAKALTVILQEVTTSADQHSLTLNEVRQQLKHIFQLIRQSALAQDPAECHFPHAEGSEVNHINHLIGKARALLHPTPRRMTLQEEAVLRLTAEAERTDLCVSPAHPHLRECWLLAADQMRLAAGADSEGNTVNCKLHMLCSTAQEKLAMGLLTTAASYFGKANTAGTQKSRVLWKEAAEVLLQTSAPLIQRCVALKSSEKGVTLTSAAERSVRRSTRLAEAAWCCERGSATSSAAGDTPLGRLQTAEAALRLQLTTDATTLLLPHHAKKFIQLCDGLLHQCHRSCPYRLNLPTKPLLSNARTELSQAAESADCIGRLSWLCEIVAVFHGIFHCPSASAAAQVATSTIDTLKILQVSALDAQDSSALWTAVRSAYLSSAREAAKAHMQGHAAESGVWCAASWLLQVLPNDCGVAARSACCEAYNELVTRAWGLRYAGSGADMPAGRIHHC
jgi:hypothetical protein